MYTQRDALLLRETSSSEPSQEKKLWKATRLVNVELSAMKSAATHVVSDSSCDWSRERCASDKMKHLVCETRA